MHSDHLGSPRVGTDNSGKVVWRWQQAQAFGESLAVEDVDNDGNLVEIHLRFAGQYWDRETGLYYNYFRDYDPGVGRYVQSDPVGLDGGFNTYSYVYENPTYYIDPDGLIPLAIPAIPTLAEAVVGLGLGVSFCHFTGLCWPDDDSHFDEPENNICDYQKGDKEHTKNKRKSTKGKHEKGRTRNKNDKHGGEKGDSRRPYRR